MNVQKHHDSKIDKIETLKWYPWIGKNYDTSKLLVIGESHYEDGDDWQNGNKDTTRTIIQKRLDDNEVGKWTLHRNVEKVLLDKPEISDGDIQTVWNKVAYWNLVQRLLDSRENSDRPTYNDFTKGWETFFDLEKILMSKYCLVLGKGEAFGSFGNYLHSHQTTWKKTNEDFMVRKAFDITDGEREIRIVFINHPSGSFGFDYSHWAAIVKKEFPDLSL